MLIEAVYRALPYSDQITNLDLSEKNAIRFEWRGARLRITETACEEVDGPCLVGSNLAIVIRTLFKRALIDVLMRRQGKI